MAITMSGIFAETGYNLIHNIEKLIESKSQKNLSKLTDDNQESK